MGTRSRLAPGGGRSISARVLFFPITGRFLERREPRRPAFPRPLGAAPTSRREDRRSAEETAENKRAQSPVSPLAVQGPIVGRACATYRGFGEIQVDAVERHSPKPS